MMSSIAFAKRKWIVVVDQESEPTKVRWRVICSESEVALMSPSAESQPAIGALAFPPFGGRPAFLFTPNPVNDWRRDLVRKEMLGGLVAERKRPLVAF